MSETNDGAITVAPTTAGASETEIDAALQGLERLDELPVGEHRAVYDAIHVALHDALTNAAHDSPPRP